MVGAQWIETFEKSEIFFKKFEIFILKEARSSSLDTFSLSKNLPFGPKKDVKRGQERKKFFENFFRQKIQISEKMAIFSLFLHFFKNKNFFKIINSYCKLKEQYSYGPFLAQKLFSNPLYA